MVGGFVGVDIFFVISGYLISSILYRNLYDQNNPGHVNIVDFYIRRVRRIFPALIAVLVFLLAIGWVILLPDEYKRLGKHVLGGSTYISNFILYYESGDYFNVDSNLKPLLHLWSLGVEEQFYLIFPIFLWGLYKLKLNFIKSLTVFTVISFLLNLYFVLKGNGSYSFYMPWTRFWELSVGAILAYVVMFKPNITNKLQYKETTANALSIVGLLLILTSYLVIPQDINFPGYRASLPVLGALCIIAAGQKGIVNKKILSSKIFIFFGLISYPLYLWHWPLLSLAWICEGNIPNRWIRLALVAISIILATLTFYFIEPPLRYGKAPKIKALSLFAVLLGLGGIGCTCWYFNGYQFRYPNDTTATDPLMVDIMTKTTKYENNFSHFSMYDEYIDNCKMVFPTWTYKENAGVLCALQRKTGQNDIAIVGDSHSAALFYGLSKVYENSEHSVAIFPVNSNVPFLGVAIKWGVYESWYPWIKKGFDYITAHQNIKVVVLTHCVGGTEYDLNDRNKSFYGTIYDGAKRTFELMKKFDKKVVYVIDNPYLPFTPWAHQRKLLSYGETKFSRKDYESSKNKVIYDKAVAYAAKDYDNVTIIDNTDLFCDETYCYSHENKKEHGFLVYLNGDPHHLNARGSLMVAKKLKNDIDKLLQK